MALQVTLPSDLEALVEKRLSSGAFASAEEVMRDALEAQDADESWSAEDLRIFDAKWERASARIAGGEFYRPEEARAALAAFKVACRAAEAG